MVNERCIIWTEKDEIMKYTAFVENKTEIIQNALKIQ
jgi:hypothetical protein